MSHNQYTVVIDGGYLWRMCRNSIEIRSVVEMFTSTGLIGQLYVVDVKAIESARTNWQWELEQSGAIVDTFSPGNKSAGVVRIAERLCSAVSTGLNVSLFTDDGELAPIVSFLSTRLYPGNRLALWAFDGFHNTQLTDIKAPSIEIRNVSLPSLRSISSILPPITHPGHHGVQQNPPPLYPSRYIPQPSEDIIAPGFMTQPTLRRRRDEMPLRRAQIVNYPDPWPAKSDKSFHQSSKDDIVELERDS